MKPLMVHRTKNNQKDLSSGKFRLFFQLELVAFYFRTLRVN